MRCKIKATWDDGCVHDLRVAELMRKYGINTVFYWPYHLEKSKNVGRVGKFLSMAQCKELGKEFPVGSHTVTHNHLTKITVKQARNEIFDSKKLWEDALGKPVTSLCYPRGYANTMIKILVKNAGYEDARSTAVGHLQPGEQYFQATTVHVGVDRVEYKGKCWEMFAREMLEKCTEDSTYHLFGHSWEIEAANDWDNLEGLLKELKDRQ